MGKFIISEQEKKRILNMHTSAKMKPFLFEEEGGPGTPITNTTPTTQPTPNPEPVPSVTLSENPTKDNPLKVKVYPKPKNEENYFLLHLYEMGVDLQGIGFKYTFPTYNIEKTSPMKRIIRQLMSDSKDGTGKWICSTKESVLKPDYKQPFDVEFSDTVKAYFEKKCSTYAANKTQTTSTGPTTA